MALTACSSSSNDSTVTPSPAASESPVVPGDSPDADASPPASSDPASVQTAAPDKPSPSPTQEQGTSVTSRQLKELLALAKKGKVPGISFAAHTDLIDDVEKAWGKADKTEAAGKGLYATYSKKNAVIGFNKGSQIYDVRSSDPKLQTLTLKQIEQTLGKPSDTTKNGDDAIYSYKANDQFQLKFIIPQSSGKVDHISVYSPKDSVNNMAG